MADTDQNPYQSPDYEDRPAPGDAAARDNGRILWFVRSVIGAHLLGICASVLFSYTASETVFCIAGFFALVTLWVCPLLVILAVLIGGVSTTSRSAGRLSTMEIGASVLVEAVLTSIQLVALLPAVS